MIVTNADRNGNTLAWRRYKEGFKSKITGKPLYEAAPHLKDSGQSCTRGLTSPLFLSIIDI